MTLIDKAEALAILAPAPNSKGGLWATRKQALYEQVAALPARDVGVPADVRDYAIDVSEAFDAMMEVERNPAGAWQAIQALAGHIAALAPTDAAQAREEALPDIVAVLTDAAAVAMKAREAALREAADVVDVELMRWGFPSTDGCKRDDMRSAILALIGEART